jgi:hypothetical protein
MFDETVFLLSSARMTKDFENQEIQTATQARMALL